MQAAEREIESEQEAIRDSDDGVRYFTVRAEQASRDAEAARKAAGEACSALQMAWRDAESQWGLLRRSYKHRGQEEGAPREVPRPDMPPPITTMSAHYHPWPGGRRPESEQAEA